MDAEMVICKTSHPFNQFGKMLEDEARVPLAIKNDPGGNGLLTLVRELKKYAWEKCGVDLQTYGTEGDRSIPAGEAAESEFKTVDVPEVGK